MITPMMKYSFLSLRSEHEKFLQSLREFGVVDVTINQYNPSQNEEKIIADIKSLKGFLAKIDNVLSSYAIYAHSVEVADCSPERIIEEFDALQTKIQRAQDAVAQLSQRVKDAIVWGEFSVEDFSRLQTQGINLRFFSIPQKYYTEEFTSLYAAGEVSRQAGLVYFILFEQSADEPIDSLANAKELECPTLSYKDLSGQLEQQNNDLEQLKMQLYSLALNGPRISDQIERLSEELHYDQIKTSNEIVADNSLVMIEGWAPKDRSEELDVQLDKLESVVVFKEEPAMEDEPPVLLKNNRFTRSCEFITNMYSLPKYYETDMTPFLAPFFLFFVGICIGDNGYGFILFISALIASKKVRDKSMQSIIDFAMYCGIATMITGSITGVFFGLEMAQMPLFEPVKELFIPTNDMFYISMAIGVVHILYAVIIKVIVRMKRFGVVYGLASLGWFITIVATICAAALPAIGIEFYTLNSVAYYITMAVSFIMMLFFQNPKASIFANFGMGIWSLYENGVGLLGDVLSYLRLFALGLTGGVIAGVFNDLAVGMSGDVPVLKYVIMILILLLGHVLNIFISFIGAFVHPLRLTFVEFYKNVSFGGGGKPYTPFRKRENNNN